MELYKESVLQLVSFNEEFYLNLVIFPFPFFLQNESTQTPGYSFTCGLSFVSSVPVIPLSGIWRWTGVSLIRTQEKTPSSGKRLYTPKKYVQCLFKKTKNKTQVYHQLNPSMTYTQSQYNINRKNNSKNTSSVSKKNVSGVYYMLGTIENKNKTKLWFLGHELYYILNRLQYNVIKTKIEEWVAYHNF